MHMGAFPSTMKTALHILTVGWSTIFVGCILLILSDVHAFDDLALRWTASTGQTRIAKALLDRGANVHAQDDQALISAAQGGHTQMLEVLLDRGANIHAKNDLALFIAASNGQLAVVKILVDRGADISGCNGSIVVRTAEEHRHQEVAALIQSRIAETRQQCRNLSNLQGIR